MQTTYDAIDGEGTTRSYIQLHLSVALAPCYTQTHVRTLRPPTAAPWSCVVVRGRGSSTAYHSNSPVHFENR